MSLVSLAAENKLPDIQIMDAETCSWIANNRPKFGGKGHGEITSYIFSNLDDLRSSQPKQEWFAREESFHSIHGAKHLVRCQIYAYMVGQYYELDKVWFNNLIIAAGIHDVARLTDKDDMGHGDRSAQWFAQNHALFGELSEDSVNSICNAVALHNKDINDEVIADSDMRLVQYLKLVDALDRYRLPKLKWWPNIEYISIDCPEYFYEFAFDLVLRSEEINLKKSNNGLSVFEALEEIHHEQK